MLERLEQTDPKLRHRPIIDLNRCIFCGYCAEVCPAKCLFMGRSYDMASHNKGDLIFTYQGMIDTPLAKDNGRVIYPALEQKAIQENTKPSTTNEQTTNNSETINAAVKS